MSRRDRITAQNEYFNALRRQAAERPNIAPRPIPDVEKCHGGRIGGRHSYRRDLDGLRRCVYCCRRDPNQVIARATSADGHLGGEEHC